MPTANAATCANGTVGSQSGGSERARRRASEARFDLSRERESGINTRLQWHSMPVGAARRAEVVLGVAARRALEGR